MQELFQTSRSLSCGTCLRCLGLLCLRCFYFFCFLRFLSLPMLLNPTMIYIYFCLMCCSDLLIFCFFSSHSGSLLDHPWLIWVLDLPSGFLRARCLTFTVPCIFGSRIYGSLRIHPSGALSAPGVRRPGRKCLRTPAWSFFRVLCSTNHLLWEWNDFFACDI